MKTDTYTKVVLTVIALVLTFNIVKDLEVLPKAYANETEKPSLVPEGFTLVPIDATQTMDVRIVGINTSQEMNVNLKRVDAYNPIKVDLNKVSTYNPISVELKKVSLSNPLEVNLRRINTFDKLDINIKELNGHAIFGRLPVSVD